MSTARCAQPDRARSALAPAGAQSQGGLRCDTACCMHACCMHACSIPACMHACSIPACMHAYMLHACMLHACMHAACMHAYMLHACMHAIFQTRYDSLRSPPSRPPPSSQRGVLCSIATATRPAPVDSAALLARTHARTHARNRTPTPTPARARTRAAHARARARPKPLVEPIELTACEAPPPL